MIEIHPIPISDAEACFSLRLRGLTDHPEAFGTAASEWREKTLDDVRKWVAEAEYMMGAYDNGELVGMAAFLHERRVKRLHRGHIMAMYVAPEARGRGVARTLLETLLDYARTVEGLEEVWLGVTVGNGAARRLYENAGFESIFVQPRHLRIDGTYYDMEMMRLMMMDHEA